MEILDVFPRLGLRDYTVQRVVSRELNHTIFNAGEWQASLGDQRFRRYHSALLTREGGDVKIFQETFTVATP